MVLLIYLMRADIINGVLDVKINYHKIKRISITEGNTNDLCEYDTGRINELLQAKEDAKVFFNKLRHSGKKLRINGIISIEEIGIILKFNLLLQLELVSFNH